MLIENMMYFALGLLVAGLVALIIMPAVWKRAVRLTKRRIEAATPITLSEFRADKDQLRAEFALTTRRLEMNVENLRKRLADQLSDANQKRADLGILQAERAQHDAVVKDLETRHIELRARLIELEKEGTDLAQKLRMRDRDLEARQAEIDTLRLSLRNGLPPATIADGVELTGDYERDLDALTTALAVERRRAGFLEEQARSLISRLENTDRRSVEANDAIADMRAALARPLSEEPREELVTAEARIARAGSELNALLGDSAGGGIQDHLADRLNLEDETERLRKKVANVEVSILADWQTDRLDDAAMRQKLNDIAAGISRLVYAADKETSQPGAPEESLFDRVQRFADDGEGLTALQPPQPGAGGAVSDRLAAVREIQGR
jgi:DNA repair exonuclease SbcCD ATPase subunit